MAPLLAAHPPERAVHVLVVDDGPKVAAGLCQFLGQQSGLEVVAAAHSGAEALALVAQHAPDLVVMDVHMPGMDGMAATTFLRAHHPGLKVILISIDQDPRVQAVCLRHGADSYLPKIGLQRRLLAEITRLFPAAATGAPRESREVKRDA